MLDLTDLNRWQVKLPNGHILNVKMPTVKRSKQLQDALLFLSSTSNHTEHERVLYDLLLLIFNDNTDGIVFNVEDIEDTLQVKHLNLILQDYMNYCIDLKKK